MLSGLRIKYFLNVKSDLFLRYRALFDRTYE